MHTLERDIHKLEEENPLFISSSFIDPNFTYQSKGGIEGCEKEVV